MSLKIGPRKGLHLKIGVPLQQDILVTFCSPLTAAARTFGYQKFNSPP